MDIEARRPWSLQQDSLTVLWDYAWGSDSDCWSLLHTAGQDNSGSIILQGPTAILCLGTCWGLEDQREPTEDGKGRRQRLQRAEPGLAWI